MNAVCAVVELVTRGHLSTAQGHLKKVNLSKNFYQVCVWYLFERLPIWDYRIEHGRWCVASGGIGHQRSFEVITQGHLMNNLRFK